MGKWHLGGKGFLPTGQGFDFYHAGQPNTTPTETEGGKGEQYLTSAAIRFISTNSNRPFFVYLAHNAPHIPYTAKTNLIARNKSALEPVYASVIEELDNSVGRLLAKLDELHLTENTLVIFTSDNGGLHVPEGNHKVITHNTPYRAGKGYMYEGGLRIPLIVRWPGQIPTASTNGVAMINTDWTPTLCGIANVKIPEQLDGIDISAILSGATQPTARTFFWHFPHYTNQGGRPAGAVLDGNWKLIVNYEDNSAELYNLYSDPKETKNLVTQQPVRAWAMRGGLEQWRESVGAQLNKPNPEFDADSHRKIYLDYDSSKFNASKATAAEMEKIATWRKRMDAALRAR